MNTGKYISFNYGSFEEIIIFSETMTHADVAQKFNLSSNNILGAGFVQTGLMNGDVDIDCYGKSVSLGIESRGDADTRLARRAIGLVR